MKIYSGSGIYDNSELITDTFAPVDLWSDNCILAYVSDKPADQRSMYTPSFGYTYKHKDFAPKISNWKQADGLIEWIQGTMIWGNAMMNSSAGYLFTDTNV